MFDCFPFFNELDLLEIRLNVHDEIFEKFVIVESTRTYSGIPKPLYFNENKHRFEKFLPKIIHIVVEGVDINSPGDSPNGWTWHNENNQRNIIIDALKTATPSDNLFMLSDTDEIMKPEKLLEARKLALETGQPVGLSMIQCMYWLNYVMLDKTVRAPYIFNPHTVSEWHKNTFGAQRNDFTTIRWHMVSPWYQHEMLTVFEAGYHFSTMGGIQQIKRKLESFGHHDQFNNDYYKSEDYIVKCMIKGKHLYAAHEYSGTCKVMPLDFLPKYIQDNAEKYERYLI